MSCCIGDAIEKKGGGGGEELSGPSFKLEE